jgi:hypothetical protein
VASPKKDLLQQSHNGSPPCNTGILQAPQPDGPLPRQKALWRFWHKYERGVRGFHDGFLRPKNFRVQNRAILRNAVPINSPLVSSEKHAAQRPEKLRKTPPLN